MEFFIFVVKLIAIHIEVECPIYKRSFDLLDKDKNLNFVMQAIVDYNTDFLDAYVGWWSFVHDALIFSNSFIKNIIEVGHRLNGFNKIIQRVPILELLIGNVSYTQVRICLFHFQVLNC